MPEYELNPNRFPTNTSLTNSTSSCPSFLAGFTNATFSYCALPLCANTTAAMAQCCGDSQVSPYHSNGGPDFHGIDNISGLNALWCHVDNSSFEAWMSCVDVPVVGACSDPASITVQEGWASRGVAGGVKTAVGLGVMVVVFHCLM
jgi:hypothetical protein